MPNKFAVGDRISVVVAGSAVVSGANVHDLLENWLRLRSSEPVTEARFYLPCTRDTLTVAVRETAMAILDFEHPKLVYYPLVEMNAEAPVDKRIEKYGAACIETIDPIPEALVGELLGDVEQGFTPYIILSWGPDDLPPDDVCNDLLNAGAHFDIPVLEIAAGGLDELSLAADPDDEHPDETTEELEARSAEDKEIVEAVEPNEAPRVRLTPTPADDTVLDFEIEAEDEAQAQEIALKVLKAVEIVEEPLSLSDVLALTLAYLRCQDKAHAQINMLESHESPLTREVHRVLQQILREADALPETSAALDESIATRKADEAAQTVTEPSEVASVTAVTKGRSRAKPGEVMVFCDEDGTIVQLAKRGPTPSGLIRRPLPREQVPDHILAS